MRRGALAARRDPSAIHSRFRHVLGDMRILVVAAALFCSACLHNPVYRTSTAPITVASVDQDRYLGRWHEQARLPNWFERDCVRGDAQYGRRSDGLISVTNTCHRADGETRVAEGRARPDGAPGEGKFKVRFGFPIWADYWVLERADDYSWSIVGERGGRYLWLLTRAETISAEERAAFEARITRLGYPVDALVWRGAAG